MSRLLVGFLMTFFGLAHAANNPAVLEHAEVQGAIATIDAWIDGLRDYENIPGLSVGLVADQTLIFAKGYGYANVRRKVPADGDTIYSICSISKLFTSIGVMQMRDAGKLSLRDPVSDHLDWFALNEQHAQAGPARIQGLLTHSAGLPREVDFPYWVDTTFPFPDRETMIAQIANQQSLYPADRLFQYSNLGLTLAGEIVAKLAQQPYQQYVQERILTPLGMADTRPRYPTKLRGKQMAIGYSGLARDRKRAVVPAFDTKAVTPAAGFTSTVNDLAKFASWQFRLLDADGKAADATDKAVLDANTLREMHRVHWVDEDWKTSWGLGFSVSNAEGTTVVGHGGGCPGYITSVQLVPKYKLAAIVLTNAGDGPAYKIASNMLRTIGPALKAAQKPASAAETDKDLSEYAGNYGGSHWGGETALRVWGDKLAIISLPSDALKDLNKLKHVADDTFMRLTAEGEERENLVFQRDEKGEVSGFLRHSQIYKRLN